MKTMLQRRFRSLWFFPNISELLRLKISFRFEKRSLPLTRHVERELSLDVLAHLEPAEAILLRPLEVDDVVPGWTVSVGIKPELVSR